jgi:hypothetical protein
VHDREHDDVLIHEPIHHAVGESFQECASAILVHDGARVRGIEDSFHGRFGLVQKLASEA